MSNNNNFTEVAPEVKFLVEDGPHYNPETREWEIVVGGDPVAWVTESKARGWEVYHDILSLNRRHRRSIPVFANGQQATMIEWEICDCGRSVDIGQDCPDCNPPAPFCRIESAAGFTAEVSQAGISYSCTHCGGEVPCEVCREF